MKYPLSCVLAILSLTLCDCSEDNGGSGNADVLLPEDIICDMYFNGADDSSITPDIYTMCLELQSASSIIVSTMIPSSSENNELILSSIGNSDLLEPSVTIEVETQYKTFSAFVTVTNIDQSALSDASIFDIDLPTTVFDVDSDISTDIQLMYTTSYLNSISSTGLYPTTTLMSTSEVIFSTDTPFDSFDLSMDSTDFDSLLMPLPTESILETSTVLESTSTIAIIPTPDITFSLATTTTNDLTLSAMEDILNASISLDQSVLSTNGFSLFPYEMDDISSMLLDSLTVSIGISTIELPTTMFSEDIIFESSSLNDFDSIVLPTAIDDESIGTSQLFSAIPSLLTPISDLVSNIYEDESIISTSTEFIPILTSPVVIIAPSSTSDMMDTDDIYSDVSTLSSFNFNSQSSKIEDLIQQSAINTIQTESSVAVLSFIESTANEFSTAVSFTSTETNTVVTSTNIFEIIDSLSSNELSMVSGTILLSSTVETDFSLTLFQMASTDSLSPTITIVQSVSPIQSSATSLNASLVTSMILSQLTSTSLETLMFSETSFVPLSSLVSSVQSFSSGLSSLTNLVLSTPSTEPEVSTTTIQTSSGQVHSTPTVPIHTPLLLPFTTESSSFIILESPVTTDVQDSSSVIQLPSMSVIVPVANGTQSESVLSTVTSQELTSPSTPSMISVPLLPSTTLSEDQLRSSLVRLVIRVTFNEHANLLNTTSQARRDLEIAVVDVYVESLRSLGGIKRRQIIKPDVKITTIGDRNSATGDVPIDFYIIIGDSPVEATLVVGVLTRNQPSQIGGYEVIQISVSSTNEEEVSSIPNSIIIPVAVAGGVLLVLLITCFVLPLAIAYKWKKGKHNDSLETVSIDVEALSYHQRESIAIQHGTPTIEKLMKRTRRNSESKRNSTLALLASSSSGQIDAWQSNQLGNEPEETPAALFQRVTHFADFQPMPSPRSFKFKFHSSAVAPSPSISNQSKTSLISDSAVKINEIKKEDTKTTTTTTTIPSSPKQVKVRERVKLHSRKVASREKRRETEQQEPIVIPNKSVGRDSEGDGGLGDVEPSSHSDGAEDKSPTHTRPSTRRRNARRKLNSRGHIVLHGTTDGYDTTDHKSRVPPSRQSRKHRSGRNMRARPLTQTHFTSSNLARRTEYDARRELAWMSTGNGVQLISIQPMEQGPPPSQIQPSWQALPQLPLTVPNQTYSREQLEQLLQIHKELERVEKGSQHQRGYIESSDSLTKSNEHHQTVLDSSSSYSAELASQAFKPPSGQPVPVMVDQNSFYDNQWQSHHQHSLHLPPPTPQMGQLLWSPQTGPQPLQTQPLSPYQLSQLRSHGTPAAMSIGYPPMASQHYHHPFGAS